MRLTIATRIFLALTAVSLVTLTLNAAITRWNFERGFLEYIGVQETATIRNAVAELEEMYRREGGWEGLRGNSRRWHDLLRENSGTPPPDRRSDRRPGPGQRPGEPPPRNDPLELGRRISLSDADGAIVVGEAQRGSASESVSIVVDGDTVGHVLVAAPHGLTDQADRSFARDQERSIFVVAGAALLFAALFSAVLARQLTRPIRSLASGAQAITAGDYAVRIPGHRGDELGDLARDFNELAEALEKNRASRRRWVADIAHELRTPLAILRGELDAIEDGVRTFDAATQKSLQAEIGRLTKLVGDLHDLSVYDEGGLDGRRDSVDIGVILGNALQSCENRLRDAEITLSRRIAKDGSIVAGDETRLGQLFTNLVENTIRYTDAPGKLSVTCNKEDGFVNIDFSDSAPAVPDRALRHLFERLFRVDASRSRDTGGSGLGLSICKAIVEAHDGSIEAARSEFGGLSIRVRLPLSGSGNSAT